MTTKGRGAGSNETGRFELTQMEMDPVEPIEGEEPRSLRTTFLKDSARSILSYNKSPDIPFDASINPYRGCEHGCIYCYARPTHEYLGFSAGLDFESKILVKEDAPKLLRKELMKPSYRPEVINISGVTDCYQPAERRFRLTRACLEVLSEFKNPFTIITKNHLVTRDLDLIAPMAADGLAAVFITITSMNPGLTAVLEPRTSRPAARLEAIKALSSAGIPMGVMVAPVIPAITDHEIPAILEAAAGAGAQHAAYVPLRLPLSVAPLFVEWLENHFPDRKEKVLSRIMDMKEGKLNEADFGSRMQAKGKFGELLGQLFAHHARRFGLNQKDLDLSTDLFHRPGTQGELFPQA
jgi:DNA repair photolyase